MPLDPSREWLAAGITGIARHREWDAVATVAGPGNPGDEVEFVALADGTLVIEPRGAEADVDALAAALVGALDPPYRAVARCREDLWAVGACSIEVARLDSVPDGTDLVLTWDGAVLALTIDGAPADPTRASTLERLAHTRARGPYAAHAHRLRGDVWELAIYRL